MSEFIGFIYAILSMIAWGTFLVPFKKIKANVYYSQFLICSGIFITSMIISFMFNFPLKLTFYGLLSGIIWAIGNLLSLLAIEDIGISRANPLWMVNNIVGFLWGVLLFNELTGFMSIVLGSIGVLCIFIGCIFIGRIKKQVKETARKRGIIFAIVAGILFGSTYVPFKMFGTIGNEYFFQMSIGLILTSTVIFLLKKSIPTKLQIKKGFMSGIIWSIGNLFGTYTVAILGISRGLPLTQLAVLISTTWGLFYFKEFKEKNQIFQIILSSLIIVIGAVLLGLAGG